MSKNEGGSMSKNARLVFTSVCTVGLLAGPICLVHDQVSRDPAYSSVGFALAVISVLAICVSSFYIMSEATLDHIKGGVIVFAMGTIFVETFSLAWIYGSFMRIPVFSFFILFLSLIIEISEGDPTEITVRKTRD